MFAGHIASVFGMVCPKMWKLPGKLPFQGLHEIPK
jgi:hypothetical protein